MAEKKRLNGYKIAKINNHWKLKVPPSELNKWAHDWEKARIDTMYANMQENDVVYYVGGECGDMPALLQKWGAQIYLFEPSPIAWPTIKKVFDTNKLDRPVGLFAMFAAAETNLEPEKPDEKFKEELGDFGWKLGEDNWPLYCKLEEQKVGFANLNEQADGLPTVAIDDVVSQIDPFTGEGTQIPTMLSIDVEGAEMEVLKGAEMTIESFKPMIFLSLHPEILIMNYNTHSRDVRNWIIDKGYKEHYLDWDHEVHFYYSPI